MTQQPFSRPGAIDLSGLQRPAGAPAGATGVAAASQAEPRSAYAVDVTEQNFQSLLEASMTAPVVLVFYSPAEAPETATMADDVSTVAGEYDGRFLAGLIDIDASPAIAQAMQIPQVPMLFVLLDGRPADPADPGPDPDRRAAHPVQPARPAAHGARHHRPPPAALGCAPRRRRGRRAGAVRRPAVRRGPGRPRRGRRRQGCGGVPEARRRQPRRHRGRRRTWPWPRCSSARRGST